MATRVVTGQHRIAAVLEGAAEEGTADGGWSKLYRDRNGVLWRETRLGGEMHGGGVSVVVSPPEPSVDELLACACHSEHDYEIAASTWMVREANQHGELSARLIDAAEAAAARGEERRARLVVVWGALTSRMNLRSTLHKPPGEVQADHEYFIDIADRAAAILGPESAGSLSEWSILLD